VTKKKIRTMEEFAAKVGLSRPTVSKFFHDPSSVRVKTRSKIEQALKATGFRPNIFAVNLNRRRTKIIGLIVPAPMDPFYVTLGRRIEISAGEAGYLALVLSSNGSAELEERAIETITSLNVGGAIIAPLGNSSHRAKLTTLGKTIPLVYIDSPLDETAPFVGTDNFQSVPLITEYLCRSGERPTFFDVPGINANAVLRREAYAQTMRRLGLAPAFADVGQLDNWEFERFAYDATARILRQGGFPTRTIQCANDRVAFGVMAALNENGARIGIGPDCDYRVAGHDNAPFSFFTTPPLTTVSQNMERMSQMALDLLFSKMGQGEPPAEGDRILLNGELVFRKSA
jgi:DNA-binding LacI/PurR family transcriptional regulator